MPARRGASGKTERGDSAAEPGAPRKRKAAEPRAAAKPKAVGKPRAKAAAKAKAAAQPEATPKPRATGTKAGASKLARYEGKRDFAATPEPDAAAAGGEPDGLPRFVIHQHSARRLHWDLRLEHDGVLASWAVPKGMPEEPGENRFAAHTEDHPIEYLDFHGEIPKGNYGAGQMTIWDHGTYELLKWEPRKVEVRLHGERLRARYALFAIDKEDPPKDWMIHRMDPPSDPEREPMPERIVPMLARTGRAAGSGRGVGLRDQVGRRARDRLLRARRGAPGKPQPERDQRQLPGARAPRPGARLAPSRARRRDRRVRRGRAPELRTAAAAHARRLARARAPALQADARELHDLRPAVAGRALADGAALLRASRPPGRAGAGRREPGRRPSTSSGTAGSS